MAAEIDLYNDTINERLVRSMTNEESFQFQTFHQGTKLSIRYYPLKPNYATLGTKFTNIALSGLTLKVGIGPRAGAEALLAAQYSWNKAFDAAGSGFGYMYGELDLNTSAMNTAMGINDSITAYLEFVLGDGGVNRIVYQQLITIYAVVFDPTGASALPLAAASYYTAAEMDELFVKWNNDRVSSRGKTVTIYSPDGTALRIIGVRNDKSAQDDLL